MTQPPLSRQIKKLEETLGVQLFERSRQGVRITEAGERLIHDARALLRKTDDTIKRYRSDSKESPQELNVGITTAIDVGILPKLISKFREKYPGIKLDVKPMMSFELIRDLKNRTLDVALIGLPSQTDNLVVEPIFSDPLTVALPSQHPLVRKKKVSLSDIQDESVFWFNRHLNPAYYEYCQNIFETLKFSPHFIPEPLDHHVLLGLVASGNGIAFVPSSLKVTKRKGVVYRDLLEGELISIGIGVAYHPHNVPKLVEEFIRTLRETERNHR